MYLAERIILTKGVHGQACELADRHLRLARQLYNAALFRLRQTFTGWDKDARTENEKEVFGELDLLKEKYPKLNLVTLIGSVRDSRRMFEVFETYRPQIVYHAAAHKHVPLVEDSPLEAIKNNVFGTKNVIESAIAHKAEKSTKAIKKEYHRIKETDLVVVALNSETVALNSRINSLLNRFTNRRMTNYDKFTESDKDDLRVLMNSAETLSKKIGVTVQ